MTFGGAEGIHKIIVNFDQKGADELVREAIDKGVIFFDTTDIYADGASEKTLGQSFMNLKISRKDVVLATKVYSRVGIAPNETYRSLRRRLSLHSVHREPVGRRT
jgi:aryl-alcohol dehydrogenase-like predicted oxidoreductase